MLLTVPPQNIFASTNIDTDVFSIYQITLQGSFDEETHRATVVSARYRELLLRLALMTAPTFDYPMHQLMDDTF